MSELETVLAEAFPVMSAAVGVYGAGVLSRVEDVAADATIGLGRRLLQRVWHRAPRPAAVESAVAELAEAPEDPDALGALRLQVRKVLAADPELLAEVAGMLPGRGAATASGEGAVALGGSNSGIISAGGGAASVHGAAVVVNPMVPGPTAG
ncbi:MAG TPA: hypothetical protein VGZ32_28255 [Actinocrinis sp.]|uniref:hypothetical protein n=1 Tax=Actinocrinis sp. TaxID=1920516 RepID=UPI002DDD2908|nr:hypothetical protein [Actinocrinis sp.]HEV3174275.1 hypothetical protein [Actinocrinis sp.]